MMEKLLEDARKQASFTSLMRDMSGYQTITTFYYDFSIADRFGEKAVRSTYRDAFNGWKHDYKYLTELYLVLNHKIWELYESNKSLAKVYDELWRKLGCWMDENLSKDELRYFYDTID